MNEHFESILEMTRNLKNFEEFNMTEDKLKEKLNNLKEQNQKSNEDMNKKLKNIETIFNSLNSNNIMENDINNITPITPNINYNLNNNYLSSSNNIVSDNLNNKSIGNISNSGNINSSSSFLFSLIMVNILAICFLKSFIFDNFETACPVLLLNLIFWSSSLNFFKSANKSELFFFYN